MVHRTHIWKSIIFTVNPLWHAHIWRTNNRLHCKPSMVWLMAQNNLMSSTHCIDIFQEEIDCFPLSIVSLTLLCDVFNNIIFAHYLSCIYSPYRSLASVGLTQAHPNNTLYVYM